MGAVFELAAAMARLAASRFGLPLIAGAVGVAYGHHWAAGACDARHKAAEAALLRAALEQRAREARAADDAAARDLPRLTADARAQAAMQATIDRLQAELAKKETPNVHARTVHVDRCLVDRAFARRLHELDRAGGRRR